MVTDLNNLVRLQKPQIKPAAEMLGQAFQDDPLCAYFIPDASQRKNKLHYLFEFFIGYGILYGEVYATSPNLEGVAVWLPPERAHMTLWREIRSGGLSLLFKLGVKFMLRQWSIGDYIFSIHKRHAPFPHWYGFYGGVAPRYQEKGHFGALLKAMFARIDAEQMPCYLETQVEKNIALYEHYGFKIVHKGAIPRTEITHWAMLREKSS